VRTVYVCVACATHYLPPESMEYPAAGVQASRVHCANPACKAAVESGKGVNIPAELLERMIERAGEEPRKPRARRPARGRRSVAGPQGGRSKLQ
jgi:hypothetical protein